MTSAQCPSVHILNRNFASVAPPFSPVLIDARMVTEPILISDAPPRGPQGSAGERKNERERKKQRERDCLVFSPSISPLSRPPIPPKKRKLRRASKSLFGCCVLIASPAALSPSVPGCCGLEHERGDLCRGTRKRKRGKGSGSRLRKSLCVDYFDL